MFILDDETKGKAEYCVANSGALPPEDTTQEAETDDSEQQDQIIPTQPARATGNNRANSESNRTPAPRATRPRQSDRKPIKPVEDSAPPQQKPETQENTEAVPETKQPDNAEADGSITGSDDTKPEGADAQAPEVAEQPPEPKRILVAPDRPSPGKDL